MNIDWIATQTCQSYVGSILESISPASLCKMRKSKLLLVVYII